MLIRIIALFLIIAVLIGCYYGMWPAQKRDLCQTAEEVRLCDATEQGVSNEVLMLINEGVDVNCACKEYAGTTPLHLAADKGYAEIAASLVKKGADVNAKEYYSKNTPLYLASRGETSLGYPCKISLGIEENRVDMVKLLIADGADVNAQDRWGDTALAGAAMYNAVHVAELLIDAGADVNHRGGQYTALEMAAYRGPDVAMLLINRGARVNTSDSSTRKTPLHSAVECGFRELVEVLLQHGADLDARDLYGKTPLDKAKDLAIRNLLKHYRHKE